MSETTTRLLKKFQNEDYRYAYDEEFSSSRMATQIQAIRDSQNLTQKELADLCEMRQTRISELENVNYSMWTVSTLRRLARALGVRFAFKFESWGELLPEIEFGGREDLIRPRFEKDPVFSPKEILGGGTKTTKKKLAAHSYSDNPYLAFMYPMDTARLSKHIPQRNSISKASQASSSVRTGNPVADDGVQRFKLANAA